MFMRWGVWGEKYGLIGYYNGMVVYYYVVFIGVIIGMNIF